MYLKVVSNSKAINDYIKVEDKVRTKRINFNFNIYEIVSSKQDKGITVYMTDNSLKKLADCNPEENTEMIIMIINGDEVYLFHDDFEEQFNCYLLDEEGQTIEKLI